MRKTNAIEVLEMILAQELEAFRSIVDERETNALTLTPAWRRQRRADIRVLARIYARNIRGVRDAIAQLRTLRGMRAAFNRVPPQYGRRHD